MVARKAWGKRGGGQNADLLNRVTIDIFVCVLAIIGTKAMVRTMKTSQELRMLSRSLSDCKSLLLNVMIQVLQFVSNSQLCH